MLEVPDWGSASSETPYENLQDMVVLCTFKIEIESQNSEYALTIDQIQLKIKMPKPHQEPPLSSKAPNQDKKDMGILCTFKIKTESQNLEQGCINDH